MQRPIAAIWQWRTLPKPNAASIPAPFKRTAPSLSILGQGSSQMGAESATHAHLTLELTAGCTPRGNNRNVFIATDFGALYNERVLGTLATEAPCLLPYFASAWHQTGTTLWTRGPNNWHQHATCRGPKGSPRPVLRLESLSAKDYVSTRHRIWPTLTVSQRKAWRAQLG